MEAAVLDTVSIDIENNGHLFKTGGQVIKSVGFMALYDQDEDESSDDEHENMATLPSVSEGDVLKVSEIDKKQHFTEPPARYTEASLIKFLEENGIGRPSTYAPIISIIISRDYVRREGKSLVGTSLGEITTNFTKENFPEIVDYEFTADMESMLDDIENGNNTIEDVIGGFYKKFAEELEQAKKLSPEKAVEKAPVEISSFDCPKCSKKMIYKTGRFGRFLACPDYPACRSTIAVDKEGNPQKPKEQKLELADFKCELCGGDMVVRNGRYGTFYACANYPACKFTKQKFTDIGLSCPKCGEAIIARHARENVKFYSCKGYPKCDFSTWDRPLDEKCPDCGAMLYYRKTRRAVVCKSRGCDYLIEREMPDDE